MQTYLDQAIADGHLEILAPGRAERIHYVAVGYSERWSDPEAKVRAEYYAELIHRYGYAPHRIGVEIIVPDRTPHDAADLIIFHDDERKRPFAVIECKAEHYGGRPITKPVFDQAVEQAWGNGNAHKFRAAYVGVVAGQTRRFLDCDEKKFGALERDGNQVADLPINYGKPPPYKFVKGGIDGKRDIAAVQKGDLITAIDKTHQTLWGGGRLSPPAAFGEFCKLIFVKVRDEKRVEEGAVGTVYDFQINTDESAAELGARIRKLYDAEMVREKDVFTERLKIDDQTIKMCVEHLESINFSATDLDTKGVAFERFLDGFFKGDFGQYFTPREIIQFCVAMMPPQADDYVLDTSCGSGGFLLYAMDHVRHEAASIESELARFRKWHDFAEKRLFGIEINDEISRVAKMNMILHDDGHTNVVAADGLEDWPTLEKINRDLKPGVFDIVLTNPPFGAVVKAAEKGQAYIDRFDLSRHLGKTASAEGEKQKGGKAAVKSRASVKTEIMFLERIHDFLKPGTGRAAIVVPDGILTNGSLQGVRDWVMERFQILAVVSLPQAAFQHSGASVKASLLFVRRRAEKEVASDDEAIFMAAPGNIGYDATGRDTVRMEVIEPGDEERRVRKHHDLFAYEAVEAYKDGKWDEAGPRSVLPHEGVLGAWARFQRDPREFFRLSPAAREALGGFAVRRGEVRERLDAVYAADMQLLTDRYANPQFPLVPLGSVATKVQYGTSARSAEEQIGTPVLRIPNLQLDGWALDNLKYLELSENELASYRLERGDILFNRTNGSRDLVGKCEVFDFDGDWAFASYLIRLRLNPEQANPYFVSAFLNTKWGRRQVEHASRQILMSNINAEEIRRLRIPLPKPAKQAELLADLNAARVARDVGLAAADAVLDGLDAFTLDKLGLTLPPPHDDTPFAVSRAALREGGKMFPNYYNPDRHHAVTELRRVGADVLDNLVAFIREQRTISPDDATYVGLANVRANTGEFVEAEEEVGGTVATFAKGDVLFAKLRPYLNKVWVADCPGVCSPEFHVLRLLPGGPIASPDYLAAVLRASPTLAQTVRMMTGNTHPRLAPEDVVELVVPVPAPATQSTIAVEIDRRRGEARRLRAEARAGWAAARQAFEDALLGPTT